MIDQNNKYCPRIFHGLVLRNITKSQLSYASCCWAPLENSIKTSSKIDFYNKDFVELRKINQQNQLPLPHCTACHAQESAGQASQRTGYFQQHPQPTYDADIQYLDVDIDYTCNLACVTCGPWQSTTWRNELKIKTADVRPRLNEFIDTYLKPLDLTKIKEIRIWGGEPFLTNTHKEILKHVISHGNAQNIKLMYNTNGTQLIDDDTKKLIEQFKFARISFSIDAIGEKFDYIRYPGKWTMVEQNLLWWKNNLPHNSMLSLTVTASILNVLDLNEVFDWCKINFDKSVYGDAIEIYVHQAFGKYGLEYMTHDMIEHLKAIPDYCQPWIQSLKLLGKDSADLSKTLDIMRENDQRRNLDFAQYFPVTASLLGYQK